MSYAVIFDGDCDTCRRFVARLREWDTDLTVEFLPAGDPAVAARFPWISPRELDASVQLVRIADGRTWQGAAAIEALVGMLPHSPRVGWLFRLPFARIIAERVYREFAKNRRRIRCEEHCRTN